jgi:hypothetical protein
MKGMPRQVNPRALALGLTLGFALLGLGPGYAVAGQAALSVEHGPCPEDNRSPDHAGGVPHKHCVKLSWRASTPASTRPGDAVASYNVYRSQVSHDPNPKQINSKPCTGTSYIDADVQPGNVYFYVTRGVSVHGATSRPSNEARAEIPPQ